MEANNHKNNCLVCGGKIIYHQEVQESECFFCHNKFTANAICENGHYICDQCHSKSAFDIIMNYCLHTKSKNPQKIAEDLMRHPAVHMHGPEHHVLVPSALLAAYHNAGGNIDLVIALQKAQTRGQKLPGGICGLWGSCGAGVGTGIFFSIITENSPLKEETWGMGNTMTAKSLKAIGKTGGPRCCKRDSYTAILTAIDYTAQVLNITMEKPQQIHCNFNHLNNECIKERCHYYPKRK